MKSRIFLVCLITLLILLLNVLAKTHPVVWDPVKVKQTIGLGGTEESTAIFVSNTQLNDVDLWIVPELQPFVSLDQTHFPTIEADIPYEVRLQFAIPNGTQTGLYDGTIHLRVGSKTYPQTLKIEITVVDAASEVGPGGGVVRVLSSESPFYGMEIFVPAGTVQEPTIFTITTPPTVPDVPLPDEFVQDGPMISIEATTELLGPVVVDVPFSGDRGQDELRLFLNFNAATQSWEAITPLPTTDPDIMRALVQHLSIYAKGTVRTGASHIYSGFNINTDALAAENNRPGCIYDSGRRADSGICVGMSLVAESYFNHYAEQNGEGLRCWWTEDTSWEVSCRAHGLYNGEQQGWVDGFYYYLEFLGVVIGLPMDDSYLVDYLKFQLLLNRTTAINMLGLEIPLFGHSILVTGWEKTGLFSGRFIVYDNQDNDQTRELDYFRAGILTLMDYQDAGGNDYDLFTQTLSPYLLYSQIHDLIESTPREYPCEKPTVISTTPPDGEIGVSRGLEWISVNFNEEMGGGHSVSTYWDPPGAIGWPLSASTPVAWSSDRRTFHISRDNASTLLDTGVSIEIVLNPTTHPPGFRDASGNALDPYSFTFVTECPPSYVPQPSYEGDCLNRPPGSVCIGYDDGYIWLVYDSIAGWDTIGNVQIAHGFSGDYHHVLNTNCIMMSE